MEKILTGDAEDLEYLTNFWIPAVGTHLRRLGYATANRISWMDDVYCGQIKLDGDDNVHYIQDFEWAPTVEDLDRTLENLGIEVGADFLLYKKSFNSKPTSLAGYACAVRGFRLISIANNDDLVRKVIKDR